jgi:hypothetical protein
VLSKTKRNGSGIAVAIALATTCWHSPAHARAALQEQQAGIPRGFSIPTVDLSQRRDLQTIVDREPGVYLGHPTTALLADGQTILCVYPQGHGRGPILLKKSVDGGMSWSERLATPENWATSLETPTLYRLETRDGRQRLILFSGLYPIRLSISENDGVDWSPLAPVGSFGGIVAMSSVVRLSDGQLMALFHDDGRFIAAQQRDSGFCVYRTHSADDGLSWSEPVVIARRSDVHLCEPGAIRSPDGKLIAVLLRENSRTRNSFWIATRNEGATWTEPAELPGALTGDRHVAAYAPDGRLVVSFRDMAHDSATRGDWVAWVGTFDDIAAGREGQYRVRLMDNLQETDCGYPGLEVLPDGTFVATSYGHWIAGESPFVVCVRFRLESLDSIAKSQADARAGR